MTILMCLASGTAYVGSKINAYILKCLNVSSDVKLKTDEELTKFIDRIPRFDISIDMDWHRRELSLMEVVERNLDRRDVQSVILSDAKRLPPDIIPIIQSYATTFQKIACERIRQTRYVQDRVQDRVLKDQLLVRCICRDENIEEQVRLILLLPRKEACIYLQNLYQFHHKKRNCVEVATAHKVEVKPRADLRDKGHKEVIAKVFSPLWQPFRLQ